MKRTLAITLALLGAAPAAVAEELQFGWRTLVEYDSEVVSQGGGQDDLIFTNGPVTRLSGEHRRFDYEIEHYSGYEKYVWLDELDEWRHQLSTRARFDLSPRARIEMTNNFQQLPQLRTGTIDDVAIGETVGDDPSRFDTGTITTNVFTTSLTTAPLPRLVTTSQVAVIYREFENPGLNSQNTVSTTLLNQALYRWNESHSFGSGIRYSTRDFQIGDAETADPDDTIDANTQTWETYGIWNWQIDARTSFSARFGPAWSSDDIDEPEPQTEFPTYPFFITPIPGDPSLTPRGFLRDPNNCPPENARPGLGGVILTGDCIPAFNQPFGTGLSGTFGEDVGIQGAQLDALQDLTIMLPVPEIEDAGDNQANLFFSFTLAHDFDRTNVAASWIRSDSQTQSLGSNTVVDTFLLNSRYHVSPRMRFNASFRFTRRFSDVEQERRFLLFSTTPEPIPAASLPGFDPVLGFPTLELVVEDASFEQTRDSYSLRFQLSRDWGRWSSAFVSLALRRQETELDSELDFLDVSATSESFLIQMGFTYRFQPIRF
jgi:hypothetical protein